MKGKKGMNASGKLLYLKAIQVGSDRGKVKNCQLCSKEFTMFMKEHQCKRCKRAVCEGCSPHKAVVQKYDDAKGHRQCNFCKMESDSMKKFIADNQIQFMQDTISKQWLKAFELDVETAQADYKQACNEVPKVKDISETQLFKQQAAQVYSEVEEWVNYSLREFFTLVLDENKVKPAIDRILTAFLCKFPEVGWSPDLILMLQFFLCFASEEVAYMLLTIIYGSIIPTYLYNRNLRTKSYEYSPEIQMILLGIDQVLDIYMQGPPDIDTRIERLKISALGYLSEVYLYFDSQLSPL